VSDKLGVDRDGVRLRMSVTCNPVFWKLPYSGFTLYMLYGVLSIVTHLEVKKVIIIKGINLLYHYNSYVLMS